MKPFATLEAGRDVIDAIMVAKQADVPILLKGPHGVGKSQLFVQAAEELDVDLRSSNLACTDPTDFMGIPYINNGCTSHAPSDLLPSVSGRGGIFLLDEINRPEMHQRAFLYQFLEERRINHYILPSNWLPAAAMNDNTDTYDVYALDDAFYSRFMVIAVCAPNPEAWVMWARTHKYHPDLLAFVLNCPQVFTPPSSPRNFSKANLILQGYEALELKNSRVLLAAMTGTLGERLGLAFSEFYTQKKDSPLSGKEIAEDYERQAIIVRGWIRSGRLDIIHGCVENLKRFIRNRAQTGQNNLSSMNWKHIDAFIREIPGDLQQEFLDWLKGLRLSPAVVDGDDDQRL